MSKLTKIAFLVAIGLMIILGIWIAVLQGKLNNVKDDKEDYWKGRYEQAQDSIDIISNKRNELLVEREKLESKRIYWQDQYKLADSLLNRIKPHQNEELDIIRNADANELNGILADRLRTIHNRRR